MADVKFENVVQSFLTTNGNPVDVVLDQASKSASFAGTFSTEIGKITRFGFTIAYRNSNILVGNPDFNVIYQTPDSVLGKSNGSNTYASMEVYFAIGSYMGPKKKAFWQLELSPVMIQYGETIYPSDAYNAAINNNGTIPEVVNVDRKVNYGYRAGLTIGLCFGNVFFGPNFGIMRTVKIGVDSTGSATAVGTWINSLDAGITIGKIL